jgi:ZIP family zinc transporter
MMTASLATITFYSIMPALLMIVGGGITSFYQPSRSLTSATQHVAAGVVFAAVAKELLPEISVNHAPLSLAVGFSLGVLGMLLLKGLTGKLEEREEGLPGMPWGLMYAVGIDLLLDGILIGVAFLAGAKGGVLVAVALAIEIFFLGLSTTATLALRRISRWRRAGITLILALLIPCGAILGASLLVNLPTALIDGVLSFGVAALLYLVTEELLIEAHEGVEAPWVTACFFAGFLVILLLEGLS